MGIRRMGIRRIGIRRIGIHDDEVDGVLGPAMLHRLPRGVDPVDHARVGLLQDDGGLNFGIG
jgi:hypothetical protein